MSWVVISGGVHCFCCLWFWLGGYWNGEFWCVIMVVGFWWAVFGLIAVLSRFFIWLIWLIASDLLRVGFGLYGWGLVVSGLCLFGSCGFPGFALWFCAVLPVWCGWVTGLC